MMKACVDHCRNDESGKRKVERGKKSNRLIRPLLNSVFSFLSILTLIACSSQQHASSTICGNGFHLLGDLDNMIEISNNEQWILVNCESNNEKSKFVRVFRVDGSASWKVTLDGFPWNTDESDPLTRLTSYRWMEDGERVYLRPVCCYDLGNHGIITDAYGLYLLNLRTGDLSTVLSGKNNDASPFSVSMSPDGKYFVYVDLANTPNILNVSNLQAMEEKIIEFDEHYEDIGAFVWTPDRSGLLFTAVYDGWESSSLYLLEMNGFILKAIVENDERLLFPTSKWDYQGKWGPWKDEHTLFLVEMGKGKDWAINVQTGAIMEDNSYDGPP